MNYSEFKDSTVDDAIIKASLKLGVPSTELIYEVVDEGSKGFLGIGKKLAVIKAGVKDKDNIVEDSVKKIKSDIASAKVDNEIKNTKHIDNNIINEKKDNKTENSKIANISLDKEKIQKSPENIDEIMNNTENFLKSIFAAMNIKTEINMTFDEKKNDINVDFSGEEMGILIGKRGNTLDSLQYLTSLYCNKMSDVYIRVKMDTENYRARRKQTLEHLAKNIAYKVKKSRRPVYLEPMNPYERRIIHSTLQNDSVVTTKSEGEEPYRKVVIMLKK